MKKLFIVTCISLLIGTIAKAQADTSVIKPERLEIEKKLRIAKKQSTTGWVLLSTGLVVSGVGLLIDPYKGDFGESLQRTGVKVLFLCAGAGLTIASIPILIVSGIKKKKARLLLSAEQVKITPQLKTNNWQYRTGIAINF